MIAFVFAKTAAENRCDSYARRCNTGARGAGVPPRMYCAVVGFELLVLVNSEAAAAPQRRCRCRRRPPPSWCYCRCFSLELRTGVVGSGTQRSLSWRRQWLAVVLLCSFFILVSCEEQGETGTNETHTRFGDVFDLSCGGAALIAPSAGH